MLGYVLGVTLVLTALSFGFFTESFADDGNSFNVNFDKKQYHPGDLLTLSGEILDVGMPVIAVSIYDPSGKILSANSLEISSENTFSKSVSLVSPFYEKTGEYTVKIDYGPVSENHYFVIAGDKPEPKATEKPVKEEEPRILSLSAEKKQYTDEDTVKISGLVSSLDSPTVLIGIYDPFGTPAGFYFGPISSDLEFSTSFLIKSGVNFKVDGTYSIKAHYAEAETVSSFDYYKEIVQPETETASQNIPEGKTDDADNSSDKNNSDDTASDEKATPDSSSASSDEKSTPKEIPDDDPAYSSSVTEEKKQKPEPESKPDPVKQNKTETIKDEKTTNPEVKGKQTVDNKNNSEKISQKTEPKKYSNLSVEDIELGKLLNQINLECDSSVLTDTIFYYDGMGPALYRLCNFDDSLDSFNDSLIENPDDVEILVNKGSALGKLGFFSESMVYYDQAIAIDPDFLPAKNNKANALVNLGSARDAILLYDEILDENPGYVTARKNLEIVLSQTMPNETLVEVDSSSSKADNIEPNVSEEELVASPEKTNTTTSNAKQKPANFFEEVGSAFSSLFGFLS